MKTRRSKSAFLYEKIGRLLRSKRYVPGERIDAAVLAREYDASPTPVRLALSRLAGQGAIDDHAHSGFHVPPATERDLHELYDGVERRRHSACDVVDVSERDAATPLDLAVSDVADDHDVVPPTGQLFERHLRRPSYESPIAGDRAALSTAANRIALRPSRRGRVPHLRFRHNLSR